MKITQLKATEPSHLRRLKEPRCESPTYSTGTHYFNEGKYQCSRLAKFDIDGEKLCKQHAGEKALAYLLRGKK